MASLATDRATRNVIARGGCLMPYESACQECGQRLATGDTAVLWYVLDEDSTYRGRAVLVCPSCDRKGGAA